MNTIGLGKALEAARERIVELEDELDEAISAREGNEKVCVLVLGGCGAD